MDRVLAFWMELHLDPVRELVEPVLSLEQRPAMPDAAMVRYELETFFLQNRDERA